MPSSAGKQRLMQGNGAFDGNLKTAETKSAAAAPEAKGILVADQPEAI